MGSTGALTLVIYDPLEFYFAGLWPQYYCTPIRNLSLAFMVCDDC